MLAIDIHHMLFSPRQGFAFLYEVGSGTGNNDQRIEVNNLFRDIQVTMNPWQGLHVENRPRWSWLVALKVEDMLVTSLDLTENATRSKNG